MCLFSFRLYFWFLIPNLYLVQKKCCFNVFVCLRPIFLILFINLAWNFSLSVSFMFRCGKSVQVFRCVGVPSAYIPIFFTSLNWNKCWFIPIFFMGVENILMSPLLYVGVVVAYILKVRPLKLLPVFSIFNPKWAIPLELCHFLNRLSFQGSFSL